MLEDLKNFVVLKKPFVFDHEYRCSEHLHGLWLKYYYYYYYFLYHITSLFPVSMRIYFLFHITCLVYTIPFIPLFCCVCMDISTCMVIVIILLLWSVNKWSLRYLPTVILVTPNVLMAEDSTTSLQSGPTSPSPQPASVSAVSIKLPPFWPADPQVWFAQVEAQFSMRNITSQWTRFDYVVAALAPEFATEVRDLLLTPPEVDPYTVLKDQLIQRTAASEQRLLQQLFTAEELGDKKPSQLLRRMQQL